MLIPKKCIKCKKYKKWIEENHRLDEKMENTCTKCCEEEINK
jgi:hypothetical protein